MRKLILAFVIANIVALIGLAVPANAQYYQHRAHFGPIGVPVQIARPQMSRPVGPPVGTNGLAPGLQVCTGGPRLPDGCCPEDAGRGGNCGYQAQGWCANYLQARAVNGGRGYPLPPECFPKPGVGAVGVQPGAVQTYQGPVTQGSVTVTTASPWTGHRVNGVFVCDSGACPANGIYGN